MIYSVKISQDANYVRDPSSKLAEHALNTLEMLED
jgi:hypothetical protein